MKKHRIVIIGGGYAGIRALDGLGKRDDVEVVVVDQNPYHYLQTEVYGFIANRLDLSEIAISLPSLVAQKGRGFSFYLGKVSSIEPENKKILFENGEFIEYDYLIIAAGSRTFFPENIKGASEFAHGVKSLKRSFEFRQKFENILYSELKSRPLVCDKKFNIVVAGAGLSGVEIAAEMGSYAKKILHSSGFFCGDICVYLIASGGTILEGLSKGAIDDTTQKLKKIGVKILTGVKVQEASKNRVILNDGTVLDSDFLVWTIGIVSSPFVRAYPFEKNGKHQIVVDKYLRVPKMEGVFACGDCADLKDSNQKSVPSTAQTAEQSGTMAAKNVLNMIDGKELDEVYVKNMGLMIAIGAKDGVGILPFGLKVKGLLAYIMKEAIFYFYKMPLRKRAKEGV